jgi:hypothetical protein
VVQLLKAVIAGSVEPPPQDEKAKPAQLSPHAKFMAKVNDLLEAREFVHPQLLCERSLDKLRFRTPGSSGGGGQELRVGMLTLTATDQSSMAAVGKFNPEEIKQGTYKYVQLHMEHDLEAVRARAPHLMRLLEKVWNYFGAPMDGKAKFIIFFLAAHIDEDDLMRAYHQEHELVQRFLTYHPQLQSQAKPPHAYGSGKRSRAHFESGDGRSQGRNGSGGGRSGGGQARVCHSRLEKTPRCSYGDRCTFSHACVSCERDHEGEECQQWDEQKAKRARDDVKAWRARLSGRRRGGRRS